MKANDFIIENSLLEIEVETIKKTKHLKERQRLDEVAPIIVAAAAALVRFAVQSGAMWVITTIGERAIEGWLDRLRRSRYDPTSSFIPEGMRVFAEDPTTGLRYSYRYNNGQWEGQVAGSWRPVPGSVDMSQIIEGAVRRRTWFDRLLGRRARGELIDVSRVDPAEMRYVTELSNQERNERNLPRSARRTAQQIRDEYDSQLRQNPESMRNARARIRQAWSGPAGVLIGNIYAALGLYAYLYQVGELIESYNEQHLNGDINREEYEQRMQSLRDNIKGMVAAAMTANVAVVIFSMILGFAFRYTGFPRGYLATISGTILIGAASAVAMNDEAQSLIIDYTNKIWDWSPIQLSAAVDDAIDQGLEQLLNVLGFEDVVRQVAGETVERRNSEIVTPDNPAPSIGEFFRDLQ